MLLQASDEISVSGVASVMPPSDEVDALQPAVSMVALPSELLQHLFQQARDVLDPRTAVALSGVSSELRRATQEGQQQLKADHEAAAALGLKLGLRSCKELREAKEINWCSKELTAADLELLGTLGSVLPALEWLILQEPAAAWPAAGPDGVQRLAARLGAGALPSLTVLCLFSMDVSDAGAAALAAALGQGALPRLERLYLDYAAIGDAGLVALAPALRRLDNGWRAEAESLQRRQARRRRRLKGW